MAQAPRDVLAAGVVAFRPGRRVLLIHRPRYDDWSFPKGKLDPGELLPAAAVREAWEETGLHVRLGPPLPEQRYEIAGRRTKSVSYWTARVLGDHDVGSFTATDEVDEVAWVDTDKAESILTYTHDRETLRRALRLRRKTVPLVVLRHGQARSRKSWRSDDRERPLLVRGQGQAQGLVPLLCAFAPTRIVTSSSVRCVQTVTPFADTTGWVLATTAALSEERASAKRVRRVVEEARRAAVDEGLGTVICSHRPVLPRIFEELGVEDPQLAPGQILVLHLRKGVCVASESHVPHDVGV